MPPPDPYPVLARLVAGVCDLPEPGIAPGTRFDGLANWSSLAALRLLTSVEEHFRIHLELRGYLAAETVEGLSEMVADLLVAPL